VSWEAKPPHDCRITIRCLKSTFQFAIQPDREFASLRSENSVIDRLFEIRQNDELGGEGGERVSQITSRPAFKLTFGRTRGATWFDTTQPPQGIVWLLGAEIHDDRHKGKSDAYDILGALDGAGELFPGKHDYQLLELHRRLRDTHSFGDDLRADTDALVATVIEQGRAEGTLAGIPVRALAEHEDSVLGIYVAVSTRPIVGARSGLEFPLTQGRFLLVQEGVREAVERRTAGGAIAGDWPDLTKLGGAHDERGFIVLTQAA